MKRLVREGIVYTAVLVLSACLIHPDLLSSPTVRFERMMAGGGYLHPFIYALFLYLLLWIFRGMTKGVRRLFSRR